MTSKSTHMAGPDHFGRMAIYGMVVVAAAFGSFLRLYRLDWQGLWLDEIHTLGPALHATSLADAFWNYINLAPTPPLYYLFMIGWTDAFGFSETVLRLPSAIIGIATIGVFWFGLRRVFDHQISAVATILMALSWPALFYSQEVRGYSAVLLFSTWASVIAVGILRNFDDSKLQSWGFLLGVSVLAAMTHPFGFIITGFLFLYLFVIALVRRRRVLQSFAMGAVLLSAYLAWLAVNLTGIGWLLEGTLFSRPDLWFFVDIGAFLFHHPVPAVLTAIIPLGVGAFAYFGKLRESISWHALTDPVVFLPFMLALPFAFAFSVAQFKPFMYTRYLIVFLPYVYMFFAVVLMSRRWPRAVFPVGLVFLLAVSAQYWILRDYYVIEKPQTRELARFVLAEIDERTAILTGCDPEPVFECTLGPGRATDASWSKYLFYLNYAQLPEIRVVPDVFATTVDLDQLIDQYRAGGVGRVIIMGSRDGLGYVAVAETHFRTRGIRCSTTEFHMAAAAICSIP